MSTRKCLVTGGAGFIGSHLVERLLSDGYQVTCLDNLSTSSTRNIEPFQNNEHFSFMHADINDEPKLAEACAGIDWLFHLAALADIVPSVEHPRSYHRANVDGTVAVLEAARIAGFKRLIYAASYCCYGLPSVFPTPETERIEPMYPYALTKRIAEEYVLHWHKVYGLPTVCLRLTNVYGPRSRTTGAYGAVFGVFLAQKLAGKPFTLVGDGWQTRDFVFVSDVVDAFVKAAASESVGESFNVGSGGTHSIRRLLDILVGDVVHVPKRPGEPDCTFADISKIKKYLNWQPQVQFEDGVKIMVDHIEDWREAPVWDVASVDRATRKWFECLAENRA
jgi:UDP-glucose 4-epimerase